MSNIKILHTADHHLRDSQYARTSRREDFLKSLQSVIDLAIQQRVYAVLSCGDMFNGTRISPYLQKQAEEMHIRCLDHKLPFYIISGNHDFTEPHWIQSVRRKQDPIDYGFVYLDREALTIPETHLTLFGAPAISRDEFLEQQSTWPEADIYMWHGMVYDFLPKLAAHCGGGLHLHEMKEALSKCAFMALGDLHICQYELVGQDGTVHDNESKVDDDGTITLDLGSNRLVGYPGSTELCYANEATTKTATLLEFDLQSSKPVSMSFQPIKHRTYLKYRVVHEEQIEGVVKELSEYSVEDPPVVILYYNPNIQGVKERIRAAIPGEEKLMQSIPALEKDKDAANVKSEMVGEALAPTDFIPEFITSGAPHTTLGKELLNPDPELAVNAKVDDYIQRRKQELDIK